MLQYRTNAGERCKPALGLYGELTVEQARALAQKWMAEVRRTALGYGTVPSRCAKRHDDRLGRVPPTSQHALLRQSSKASNVRSFPTPPIAGLAVRWKCSAANRGMPTPDTQALD
ncbi:hypothetical protein HNR28_003510 [Castellaniella defragrans]|uniref:Integrase DNA-binding domain-containing protein n=1 Tax=Castellaniella defragrans TaxID=75697 RepID=A0A7W9TRB0_CASDE|nr:hypothetical protein [Castellaniella defragrans]